jgi:hypothetical protein
LKKPGYKKNVRKAVIARSEAILNPALDGRRDLLPDNHKVHGRCPEVVPQVYSPLERGGLRPGCVG